MAISEVTFRKPLFRRKLHISGKPYFIEKDRESGEKDLEGLVDTAKHEGCWLFDVKSSSWYSISSRSLFRDWLFILTGYMGVVTFLPDLSQFGKKISHYHIHPRCIEDRFMSGLSKSGDKEIDSIARNYAAIGTIVPSNADIKAYSKILQQNFDCFVNFKIVSPSGRITLKFDEKADLNKACEVYKQIHNNEKRFEIAASANNPRSAISKAVKVMNQHMSGILTASMRYRNR